MAAPRDVAVAVVPDVAVLVARQSVTASGEDPNSTRSQIKRAIAAGVLFNYETRDELVYEELDTSGRTALEDRDLMLAAVEAIEDPLHPASVLVVAYYDRLARSVREGHKIIERVEAAGGRVIALDSGVVSLKTAAGYAAATYPMVGHEAYALGIRERTLVAIHESIMDGTAPIGITAPGLRKTETGGLEPDPATTGLVRQEDGTYAPKPGVENLILHAYRQRERGLSKTEIRDDLAERGLVLSYTQVETLLRRELYTGVMRWGSEEEGTLVVNPAFCWPIIPTDLYERVQSKRAKRGPVVKSERLLARTRLLRCPTCGGGMGYETATARYGTYPVYRCKARKGDCSRKVSIACWAAEEAVLATVEAILRERELQGEAGMGPEREEARAKADHYAELFASAQRGAMKLGTLEEPETLAELAELKATRDEWRRRENSLAPVAGAAKTVRADDLAGAPDEIKRELIADLIASVTIKPGVPGRPTREVTLSRVVVVPVAPLELVA